MSNIFITGGTGFLGSELIYEILSSSNDNIYALVRGDSQEEAETRLITVLRKAIEPEILDKEKKDRIRVCLGDVTQKDLGLKLDVLDQLAERIDVIYNSAALTNLNSPWGEVKKANVDGTKNVLEFAILCRKKGQLKKVNHISTAYVVGTKVCTFMENDLNVGQKFNNTYERSKYEAEKLVHKYRKRDLDIDIFRPSIILGRYKDGRTTNLKMFYQPLHFFALGLFDKIPALNNSKANLINVDIAAKVICQISSAAENKNGTYHVVSPTATSFNRILEMASDYFGFKIPNFVTPDNINMGKEYSVVRRRMIEPYVPYFSYQTVFDLTNTKKALKDNFDFPEFDEKNFKNLYGYCDSIGFIKRKEGNVVVK